MPRENARKTENAWKQRDEEAARNQERAAGRPADVRFGGGDQMRTMKVQIVGADSSFIEEIKRSMGVSTEGQSNGATGNGTDFGAISNQLQAILTDQQAIGQATKQISQDLSLAVNMVMNYQAAIARQMGTYTTQMTQFRQQETQHMQNLLGMMSQAAATMTGITQPASPAGGGGGGGGGTPPTPPAPPGGTPPRPPPGPPNPNHPPRRPPTALGQIRNRAINSAVKSVGGPNSTGGRFLRGAAHGGLRGGLRSNLMTAVPLAMGEGVNDAAIWVTNQRQQNAGYQSIYNGSNYSTGGALSTLGNMLTGGTSSDTSGFSQRMQEEGFVLGQRFSGGMTSDQSRQAFEGVSQLGYGGDQRANALQFVSDNYKQMGMDIAQSLQLVQTAAQNGNQSLSGLSGQLQALSAQAAATGQNAGALRQQFATTYQQALQSGLGAGSGQVAQVLTSTTAGTSRDLAGLNYNSLLSNPVLMQTIAASGGMSLGQMESQVSQGNTGAFTNAAGARINQVLTGSMDQNVRTLFQSQVQQAGGYSRVAQTPGSQYDIANQLMNSRDWNVMQARAALGTVLGPGAVQSMNDQQIAEYYVSTLTSGGVGAAGNAQQKGLGNLTGAQKKGAATGQGGSSYVSGLLAQQAKGNPQFTDWVSQIWGGDKSENDFKNLKGITQAYSGYENQSGKSNPAIESMITALGTTGTSQLRVKTPQGDRVVSMQDAIKYYSDQISTGSAIVEGGPQNGKTLGEATGTTIAGFKAPRPGGSGKNGPGNVGQSWSDYQKANPSQQQGPAASSGTQTNGTVTVAPSAMLMQLFNWSSTGGVNITGSTAAGVTPSIPGGPN